MKAIHFGGGNIGRGFIGLILRENNYDLIFADVNESLINNLKNEKQYNVILADENKEIIRVDNIDAVNSMMEPERLKAIIAETDLITTAVGTNILEIVAKSIVPGLKERLSKKHIKPLNIIACENAINATDMLRESIFAYLNEEEGIKAKKYVGFPNSAVDRIVPIQDNSNSLDVLVEPFYEWIIEGDRIKGSMEKLKGVQYVHDLDPYIQRKLFTVNTAHASTAYIGNIYGYKTISSAMNDRRVEDIVRGVLEETSYYLVDNYGFDKATQKQYIDTTINRFKNPHISDDIIRVGRSPIRKISKNERLVYPAIKLLELGHTPKYLCKIIAYALKFIVKEDKESVELENFLKVNGVKETLRKYSQLDENSIIIKLVEETYNDL